MHWFSTRAKFHVCDIICLCITSHNHNHRKKKATTQETPEMEKNVNYGVDDDYYNEHDDRVQDTNDYYQ